ncbi:unnamed protein product [Brachionus calyciflorus]|uniref:GRAM domain-containing protein n=1 Tax=Brachionus calyciflorus TaxID=104777 RepID=A0A813UZ70_9BILA|nr:unnamed protein product [Brachionus calyciflorus]
MPIPVDKQSLSIKSAKNSTKNSINSTPDKNDETNYKDLNNNKNMLDITNLSREYSSLKSDSSASLNHVNNSSSSSSSTSTITSPELTLNRSKIVNTPVKRKTTSKSNIRFHQLFPSISLDEVVVATYSCAYVKSLNLYQGVMFLTSNYICFYSKILNHENILILKLTHVNSIVKTMHALIFPTAIRIETKNSTYSFTSFRSRGNTLDHLHELLQSSRQRQIDRLGLNDHESNSEKSNYLNITISDFGSEMNEKNQDEIKKIEELKRKLDDETTSISRTISESNLSNSITSAPAIIYQENNSKSSPYLPIKKTNSIHFTSPHTPKQQSNNLSYVLDFRNNTVIVSLKHKKTLLQKAKILLGILIPGFFDLSRIDALLPICFIMCILLLLNAFVLLNKVNQVDDLFNELLLKNEF